MKNDTSRSAAEGHSERDAGTEQQRRCSGRVSTAPQPAVPLAEARSLRSSKVKHTAHVRLLACLWLRMGTVTDLWPVRRGPLGAALLTVTATVSEQTADGSVQTHLPVFLSASCAWMRGRSAGIGSASQGDRLAQRLCHSCWGQWGLRPTVSGAVPPNGRTPRLRHSLIALESCTCALSMRCLLGLCEQWRSCDGHGFAPAEKRKRTS